MDDNTTTSIYSTIAKDISSNSQNIISEQPGKEININEVVSPIVTENSNTTLLDKWRHLSFLFIDIIVLTIDIVA